MLATQEIYNYKAIKYVKLEMQIKTCLKYGIVDVCTIITSNTK